MEKREWRTNNKIWQKLNRITGYDFDDNYGSGERVWPVSQRITMDTLKFYFRRVATGEVIPS